MNYFVTDKQMRKLEKRKKIAYIESKARACSEYHFAERVSERAAQITRLYLSATNWRQMVGELLTGCRTLETIDRSLPRDTRRHTRSEGEMGPRKGREKGGRRTKEGRKEGRKMAKGAETTHTRARANDHIVFRIDFSPRSVTKREERGRKYREERARIHELGEKAGSLNHAATTTGLQKQTPHLPRWLLPRPTPCCHYVCLCAGRRRCGLPVYTHTHTYTRAYTSIHARTSGKLCVVRSGIRTSRTERRIYLEDLTLRMPCDKVRPYPTISEAAITGRNGSKEYRVSV